MRRAVVGLLILGALILRQLWLEKQIGRTFRQLDADLLAALAHRDREHKRWGNKLVKDVEKAVRRG